MRALARYIAAACIGAQCWVAPVVVYLLAIGATDAAGGSARVNVGLGAAWLFPVTAWLTVATLNAEDDDHLGVTAAAAGGSERVRRAKLLVASALGLALTAISLVLAAERSPASLTASGLMAGLVAHLTMIAGGTAVGALCARPLISRPGWAAGTISLITIADLVIPDAPPERVVLAAIEHTDRPQWGVLLGGTAGTLVLAALVLTLGSRVARART